MEVFNNVLTWTPTEGIVSSGIVTISVSDDDIGNPLFDTQDFMVTVTPINDPPIIVSIPDSAAFVGELYEYQVVVEDPDEIVLENEGELLLDGTDSSQTDAGFKLLQNTPETVVTTQDGGVILLDGTDSTGSDAGLSIILEGTTDDLGFPTPIRLERDVRTVTSSSKYATFILEESGTLITESNSSESVTDRLLYNSPNETGEILLDTNNIAELTEYLEWMEFEEDKPMKALVVSKAEEYWK